MNLKSASSSIATSPELSQTLYFTDDDISDYPEDGMLVNAETSHAGPSYSSDNQVVSVSEDRRYKMVKFALDKWAKADKLKKHRQEQERKMEEQKEREARKAHEEWVNWQREVEMQDEILKNAYAVGHVNVVQGERQENVKPFEASKSTTEKPTDDNNELVFVKEQGITSRATLLSRKASKNRQKRESLSKPKKQGLRLGLAGYDDADEGAESRHGADLGLAAYESDGGEDSPIFID